MIFEVCLGLSVNSMGGFFKPFAICDLNVDFDPARLIDVHEIAKFESNIADADVNAFWPERENPFA